MPIITLEPIAAETPIKPVTEATFPTPTPTQPFTPPMQRQKKVYYKPKYNQVNSKYSFDNDLTEDDVEYLAGFMADRVRWICSQPTLRPHDLAIIAGSGREQVRHRLEKFKSAREVVFDIVKKEG